jgi:hypothetical protein
MSSPSPEPASETGWQIVTTAVREAQDLLGRRFVTAYALGSLAHGGFAPSASDVDVAILTDKGDGIEAIANLVKERTEARIDSPLARRLSIFHGSWPLTRTPGPGSRFPAIDRLDLVEHGVLIAGEDRREQQATRPSSAEVIGEAVAFFLTRIDVAAVVDLDVARDDLRTISKVILAPIRLLWLVESTRIGSNDDAVEHYLPLAGDQGAQLAASALSWRRRGYVNDRDEAQALISAATLGIHIEVVTRLAKRPGIPNASELAELAERLSLAETDGVLSRNAR